MITEINDFVMTFNTYTKIDNKFFKLPKTYQVVLPTKKLLILNYRKKINISKKLNEFQNGITLQNPLEIDRFSKE